MTHENQIRTQLVHHASMSKRMCQGALIAFILILAFLLTGGWFTQEAKPEWGELWIIKPLIIVPLAGALGGLFYYLMDYLRYRGGWKKILAIVLSLFGYIVGLWLGTVLGLNGVWWH